MRTHLPAALLVTALAGSIFAAPAQAQVPRTFVSSAGSDANNCANVTTPCRHFAAAYAATAPSGEIFVLDPANYGSLTITHAVSIEGHGWASIAPPNNGNAITINAGAGDSISIHGISINGTGATGNTNGIVFNSGSSLTVTDCIVQKFAGNSFNGAGILFSAAAPAMGLIDHVVAVNNEYGIKITSAATVAISNSIASDNSQTGIFILGGTTSIDNVSANGNIIGIDGESSATVMLGRSVVTGNTGQGIENGTINAFFSFQDNRIYGNNPDIDGPLNHSRALN